VATKISVINFKGGVGKTTLAFHLATFLAKKNKNDKILVVDVDHQSSLSIVILGSDLWEESAKQGKTTNRIFESFCNRKVLMPGKDIIVVNPFHLRRPRYDFYPNLDLVPAQFELDDTEIEMASTTIGGPTVSEWDKRTLLATWLDLVDADKEYKYIVFDCPPATKLVSQNALAASDYFVIPVIPDEMSSRGVTHFRKLVKNKIDAKLEYLRQSAGIDDADKPKSYVPTTKIAGIVPFMAKYAGNAASGLTDLHTRQIKELKNQWKGDFVDAVVKHMSGVAESMNSGWPVWNSSENNATPDVISMMENMCQKLEKRL